MVVKYLSVKGILETCVEYLLEKVGYDLSTIHHRDICSRITTTHIHSQNGDRIIKVDIDVLNENTIAHEIFVKFRKGVTGIDKTIK